MNLKIEDELEEEFRRVAVKRFGARRGFLKKAIHEAIQEWIEKNTVNENG